MPIIKKSLLNRYTTSLEERYSKLAQTLQGKAPNPNIYNHYHNDPKQYEQDFCHVDELDVKLAINDFEGILKELKLIKKLAATKIGR